MNIKKWNINIPPNYINVVFKIYKFEAFYEFDTDRSKTIYIW